MGTGCICKVCDQSFFSLSSYHFHAPVGHATAAAAFSLWNSPEVIICAFGHAAEAFDAAEAAALAHRNAAEAAALARSHAAEATALAWRHTAKAVGLSSSDEQQRPGGEAVLPASLAAAPFTATIFATALKEAASTATGHQRHPCCCRKGLDAI